MNAYKNPQLPVETRLDDLISRMTLDEKIAQTNQILLTDDTDALKQSIRGGAGSVILGFTAFAGREKQPEGMVLRRFEMQRVAVEESRLGIPLIFGRDVIHGHHTVAPIPLAQAASWDSEAVREAARVMAEEALRDGVHWTFAPMMDIARDPRWGRVIEGFGEDPYLASSMARAMTEGIQSAGMAACAKHYVGYGASEGGRDYNSTDIPDYTLHNVYLPPFRAAAGAGIKTVMSSFNDINGVPTTSSHKLLTGILKEDFGFNGFIISDWESVAQLVRQGVARDLKEAAELAFNAGLDMDMCTDCYVKYLPELVAEGKVTMARVDDAARRILRVKFELGLFERPYAGSESIPARDAGEDRITVNVAKNGAAARKLSARSMVLLKNEDGILPLPDKNIKIAVIGPFAENPRVHLGAWMLDGRESDTVNIVRGIRESAPDVELITARDATSDEMLMAVRKADVVIAAVGESHDRTGEAHSVASLSLSPGQRHLIEAAAGFGKPVIAVVCAGRPMAIGNILPHARAVLYAWHSGTMAGHAIADVLFGRENPRGKLPITIPRGEGQIPLYYNHRNVGRRIDEYYGESDFNNYEDCPGSPQFPFGFGLQYTAYEYGPARAGKASVKAGETVVIQADVKNTGSREGRETVQLYLSRKCAGMIQPVRELKGFTGLTLKPGETGTAVFKLQRDELGFYMPDGTYTVKPGEYTFRIGGDCMTENSVTVTVE